MGKTIQGKWVRHVRAWNKEKFGKRECWGCFNEKQLSDIQTLIVDSISEHISEEIKPSFPIKFSYPKKNMDEFKKLIFLIEKCEELLFEDGSHFFTSIIFDAYNIKYGAEGLLKIIGNFVELS